MLTVIWGKVSSCNSAAKLRVLQGGPLPVSEITPIIKVITHPIYSTNFEAIYRGYFTPFLTRLGAHLVVCFNMFQPYFPEKVTIFPPLNCHHEFHLDRKMARPYFMKGIFQQLTCRFSAKWGGVVLDASKK